jgi:subtilisin family serine protease
MTLIKLRALALTALLLVSLSSGVFPAFAARPSNPISPELQQILAGAAPNARQQVIVTLASAANLANLENSLKNEPFARRQEKTETALKADADRAQAGVRPRLDQLRAMGQIDYTPFWVFNGFSLSASPEIILEMASRPEVLSITPEKLYLAPPLASSPLGTLSATAPNIAMINAPALWDLGFTGQGVVVANLDTGVDGTHPDLVAKYRGGTNSWFDPYNQHATPTDLAAASSGHGTATMSLMVASNPTVGNMGAAPGAQWIAAKIFNDAGTANTTSIHLAFQWLLDPDGNPATPDAPQVVNGSWGTITPGCDTTFQPDLQALRTAGILPIISAGNIGPGTATDTSPANLPEVLSVGAIDSLSLIAVFSSRGPNSCATPAAPIVFPMVVAPGVNIPVAAPNGLYTRMSGTSFSAPQTAGVLALLLSAFHGISPAQQVEALTQTTVKLGLTSPNDTYGYGQIDALAAYNYLKTVVVPATIHYTYIPQIVMVPVTLHYIYIPLVN